MYGFPAPAVNVDCTHVVLEVVAAIVVDEVHCLIDEGAMYPVVVVCEACEA